jgi:hypothetical protein
MGEGEVSKGKKQLGGRGGRRKIKFQNKNFDQG